MPRVAPRRLVFSNASSVTVVPWDEEPLHRALLTNRTTHVYEARLSPGQATLFHSHTADHTTYVTVGPPSRQPVTVHNEVAVADALPPSPVDITFTKGDLF